MSLAVESDASSVETGGSVNLPIDCMVLAEGVRSAGLDEAHVALLMETKGQWPPIVVWGDQCVVVDGAHRVAAARRLGYRQVAAVRFEGSADEAYLESVRQNVSHGLPLSVADRRRAAVRVLTLHADWSDRRVAWLCGLSGKTVARVRRAELRRGFEDHEVVVEMERRVGRDGKARPVQLAEVRERIRQVLEVNPGGSLRTIAELAGASPETVRTVRARLSDRHAGETPVPDLAPAELPEVGLSDLRLERRPRADGDRWDRDPALLTCDDGGEFARWFTRSRVGEDWTRYVSTIPVSRIYEVVDEARRRAGTWTAFASMLECRNR